MAISDQELRLDGNAAAGLLHDVFVPEFTSARGACASCGAVGEMGVQHLYMTPRRRAPCSAVRHAAAF